MKEDDSDIRLEKKFTWQSPGWSDELLKEKTVRLWYVAALCARPSPSIPSAYKRSACSGEKHHLTYGGLLFLFLLVTAPHWIKVYERCNDFPPQSLIPLARQGSDCASLSQRRRG